MKKIWILFRQSVRRGRAVLFASLAVSLMLCMIFEFIGGSAAENKLGGIPVGIIDRDGSALSSDFLSYLEDEQGMELTTGMEYDALSSKLIERDISALVEIPEGFSGKFLSGEDGKLEMTVLGDYENAAFLNAYLDSYLSSVHILAQAAQGDQEEFDALLADFSSRSIPVAQNSASALTRDQINQREGFVSSMGFFVMLCFVVALALSNSVFDDRIKGLYQRIQVASVKPIQYIIGNSLFGILSCVFLVVLFFAYIGIKGYDIGVPFSAAVSLSILYILFVIGFAFAAALYMPSKNTITALTIGSATIASILGGAYFPIDTSPAILQKLALLTPHYWFVDALRKLQESPNTQWGINALAIFLFALLCFLLAGIRFSQSRPDGEAK